MYFLDDLIFKVDACANLDTTFITIKQKGRLCYLTNDFRELSNEIMFNATGGYELSPKNTRAGTYSARSYIVKDGSVTFI